MADCFHSLAGIAFVRSFSLVESCVNVMEGKLLHIFVEFEMLYTLCYEPYSEACHLLMLNNRSCL